MSLQPASRQKRSRVISFALFSLSTALQLGSMYLHHKATKIKSSEKKAK